ncbi:MAG: hypothetical protein LC750_18125 [Actinobacteria bacterium]|nr:hypothetical protein [Actinomycetota bacterium]
MRANEVCPRCGSSDVGRIVYGDPAPATVDAADRGEVQLGGCMVGPGQPSHWCRACGNEFGEDMTWRDGDEEDEDAYWDDQTDADGQIHA